MDNKDEIVRLLGELPHVIQAESRPLPDSLVDVLPEGSLTFYVRQFIAGAGVNGSDRDNHAEIYVPLEVHSNPECNPAIVQQMSEVLAEIETAGKPNPTINLEPIIPPVAPDETQETTA